MPGHAARNASASASVSTSGGASRIRARGRVVDDEARLERGCGDLGRDLLGQVEPDQQAGAAHLGDAVVLRQAVAQVLAECRDVRRAGRPSRSCRARRARPRRRPGCRRRWCRGCRAASRSAAAPVAMQAPIGKPACEPLRDGDDVGGLVQRVGDGGVLVGVPRAGAADPGLDLVEPQQRAVLAGDLAGLGQVVQRRCEHAGLTLQRLEDHGRGLVGHGIGQGRRHRRTARR